MAEVETSQPATVPEPSGSVAVAAFKQAEIAAGVEPTPATEPEEAQPATQSSIVIPISKVPEKFRANPDAVFGAYENSERAFHGKAQEAAQLKRDNEALNARLAAAEQVNRMNPVAKPAEPNLSEMVITETPRFVETIEQRAGRIARDESDKASRAVVQEFRIEQAQRDQGNMLIATFESAKAQARKQGFEVSDQEWPKFVNYAARVIKDESPERLLDPSAYIEHLSVMRGTPKASLPTEGNPPVAARAAQAPSKAAPPTLSREDQQLKKRIWEALKLKDA